MLLSKRKRPPTAFTPGEIADTPLSPKFRLVVVLVTIYCCGMISGPVTGPSNIYFLDYTVWPGPNLVWYNNAEPPMFIGLFSFIGT